VDLLESDGADLLFGDWAIQKHAGGSYAESDSHAGRYQVFLHLSSISRLHSLFSSAVGDAGRAVYGRRRSRWDHRQLTAALDLVREGIFGHGTVSHS
jgi:hypothetical protein